MKITFGNIQHILELLTTTEWINKYDPKIKLQKLEDRLSNTNDPKKKKSLEKAIESIKQNIDPEKSYTLTLEHAGISKNEAQLLLANLHLLYDADPSYQKESQEAVIKLLKLNFDKLNSHEIYEETKKNNFFEYNKPEKLLNPNLYNKILPYCKIIATLFSDNIGIQATEIAKKASTYFANLEDVISYFKTVDYQTKETILLSFQYEIPSHLKSEHLEFFQKLNGYVPKIGKEILTLFSYSQELEYNEEFQKLIDNEENKKLLQGKQDLKKTEKVKELIEKVKTQVIKSIYYYDEQKLSKDILPYIKELAEISLKVKLDVQAFRKGVNFITEQNLKKEDRMPDIKFTFEVESKKYFFSKLPANDMRGFVLGKLTNSCQSIGSNAEKCVLDGMSKENAGFYIVTDEKGKIKGQSYAWLAEKDRSTALVLDSFEYLGQEDIKLFVPAMNELKEKLTEYKLTDLYVGTKGQTPELKVEIQERPNPKEKNLHLYPDSAHVYHINSELPQVLFIEQPTTNIDRFNNFEELKNNNIIISFYLLLDNFPEDKMFFIQNINGLNSLLSNIRVDKFMTEYRENPVIAKNLIKCGIDVANLVDSGISVDRLLKLYEKSPNIAKNLLDYSSGVVRLSDIGLSAERLINLYKNDFSLGEYFIKYTKQIKILSEYGISVDELIKISKNNLDLAKDFIQYGKTSVEICEILHGNRQKLIELYEKYPHIAKALMRYGKKILELAAKQISLEELIEMDQHDPEMTKFFDKNHVGVINLKEFGISVGKLVEIYIKNPQVAQAFILFSYRTNKLNKEGVSGKKLIEIYEKNPIAAKYIVEYADNISSLLKSKIKIKELIETSIENPELAKLMLIKAVSILKIIEDSSLKAKDILTCNTKQLEQLLKNSISPNDLKIILKNQQEMSGLSSLLNHMKKIGLKPDDHKVDPSCKSGRPKRAADSCLKEDEEFRYDPLEEKNLTPEQVEAHRYAEMIGLATTWELSKRQKHKNLHKAIKYHQNIGDVINEGQDNWSTREKKILGRHQKYNQGIASKETSVLQEVHNDADSWHNHKVKIYDNGKSSLLVFKASGHFKIYSSDLDYQRLYRIENTSNEELNAFIDAFFMWKEGDADHKLYTLSKDIPHKTLKQIHTAIYHPKKVQSDYKILEMKKDFHVEDVSLKTIHDVFVLDNKPINIEQLTAKFFKINHEKITLRIDNLHEVLQYLDPKEQEALFKVVAKYDLDGSWQKGKVLDDHTSKVMVLYSKEVIKVIKEQGSINLNKLSELSWSSFEEVIKDHKDLGEELGSKVLESTKSLHNSFSTKSVVKEVGTQGLFFLPSIIKAVNTNRYQGLAETGGMIVGDTGVNKLVESLAKYLPAERAALLGKLSITSPIFKALTIYSIVELHKELNDLPADAPQRKMVKHELLGQYATVGLICAEALGIETGPAWFVLMGAQLLIEAEDMRAMYKLDVSFLEALEMSLGFEQDKLNSIMKERELVDIDLASHQESKAGYAIVQVPKVDKIEWQDVQSDSIPQEVRRDLSDKALSQSKYTNNIYSTVESGIYKLTQSYEVTYIKAGLRIPPIPLVYHKSPKEQWQTKKVYLSPKISKITFGQYVNNQKQYIESNNWFLDKVQHDNHTWTRVPQNLEGYVDDNVPKYAIGAEESMYASLPIQYKRVGPTANIMDPVSLTETGHAALYINQQAIKHNPNKLNHIQFSFDPRRGAITLDITVPGLINMDNTNNVYMKSLGNNVNYTGGKAYIFETIVSKIPLHESVEYVDIYNNGHKETLTVQSDSMRVMAVYLIEYNTPCVIQDNTNMTMIQFFNKHKESSGQFKQYLINGTMQDLSLETWSNVHTAYDTSIKLNSNKKYLSLELKNLLIKEELVLGADFLEVMNVQGRIVDHSTLKITSNTQSFNTTLQGNIIVTDNTATLTLKGLSSSHNTITFSKSMTIDHMSNYTITIGRIAKLLYSMPKYSVNNDKDIVLHTKSVSFKFSGIKGHFNTPQHSIVSFSGTIDGKNAVLKSYNNIYVLDILDSQGHVTMSEYTHYGADAISIDQSAYITRVFDYFQKSNNMVLSHSYVERGSNTTIGAYKTHGILDKGRVYEFTTPYGLTITHYFPQDYRNIEVNNIVYTMVNDNLCAIDGQNHKIDGDNLLSIGTLEDNKANIYFSNNVENSVVSCNAGDLIINGITLHNIAPETNIIFEKDVLPLDVLADTIHCNIDAHKLSKRSLLQDKLQTEHPEASAMTSNAAASSSWINDGVKAIKSLFNTLLQKPLLSSGKKHNESKEAIIEVIPKNTSSEYVSTDYSTDIIVYNAEEHNNIILDNCTVGARSGREYVDGAICHLPDGRGKVMIFPIKPVDSCAVPMTEAQDTLKRTSCTPIEFNGQKSVYCEGEKTSAIYTPAETARLFDNIDSNLMLGLVSLHLLHQVWGLITTTKVVENKVIINENIQKQWTHDINNINNLLKTISQDLELHESDQKVINHCNNILQDMQEDINRIVKYQKPIPQTHVDSINNQFVDLEAELAEIENSYYYDAWDSDRMHTAHEETDTQAQCTNIQEIQIPHNIGISNFAENHLYSDSLLGDINNASGINLF